MKKIWALSLALALALTGCGWREDTYVHVTAHKDSSSYSADQAVSATNYAQLQAVLEEMVAQGTESGVINVTNYERDEADTHMESLCRHIRESYPLGAYAVEDITYEIGANSGKPAIAVSITYRHSSMEIRNIRKALTMGEAVAVIQDSLEKYEAGAAILVENYEETDFSQLVRDYAESHPESVMETPQVTAAVYGTGRQRVAELTFTYQTSRDSLRQMQSQVKPVFDSAALYVSGEGADLQKYSQLYAFLMERFEYTLETSITPSYSLLRHGVGDSRAFAMVYASMCRRAGLSCQIVTGTRNGEPWTWNIVLDNGSYFHVDLLRCSESGGFRELVDGEMTGYVWDYSAYPACVLPYEDPDATRSGSGPTGATEPEDAAIPETTEFFE